MLTWKTLLCAGVLCCLSFGAKAQGLQIDTVGFQTFSYQEGDTTYLMKQYFMCFLKKGPIRDQVGEEADQIQTAHLAHLESLALNRKICMAGPFADDGNILGIVIFNTPTLEEAQRLANADPAVLAGRIIVEIHPWWAAAGSQLF